MRRNTNRADPLHAPPPTPRGDEMSETNEMDYRNAYFQMRDEWDFLRKSKQKDAEYFRLAYLFGFACSLIIGILLGYLLNAVI
jgi:hypothetical protein